MAGLPTALVVLSALTVGMPRVPADAAVPRPALAGPALAVDASRDRHPISTDIYGVSFADRSSARAIGISVDRTGGNATSRFNWRNDTHNTGSDYFFEDIPPNFAGRADDDLFFDDRGAGLRTWMTVPTIGWVARNPPQYAHPFRCGFPRSRFPNQDAFDPWDPECGNGRLGGQPLDGAVPGDTSLAIDTRSWARTYVEHLVAGYGRASAGGTRYYALDNEPALWHHTHRDVRPDPLSYDAYAARAIAGARGVKEADPSAKVTGPGDWGWCAYLYSPADPGGCSEGPDRQAHGGKPLAPFFLARMRTASEAAGHRLLDHLDEHYYPQAPGIALQPAGSAATQALRLRTTRSLWDPRYKDESWISDTEPGGVAVRLIPRMRAWVAANYPGTRLAIGEYNFGGLESLNGALAQADVLGILARERVDLAALWAPLDADDPWAFAFRMFRNVDGRGGAFGDTWVRSTSADQSKLAIYGAQRGPKGSLTIVVINKSPDPRTSTISLAGFVPKDPVRRYQYSAANLGAIVRLPDLSASATSLAATFPASSITTLILAPKDPVAPVVSRGPQPGLRGDVPLGGRPLVLAWAASDAYGVESYQLQRSVDGGPYQDVALPEAGLARAWLPVTPSLATRHRYRVRAVDGAGNRSAWAAGPAFRVRLVEDSSPQVAYVGAWAEVADPGASGGSVHIAPASGSPSATLSAPVRAFALVTRRGYPAPVATVAFDGATVAARSLESITGADFPTRSRQVLVARTWPANGPHSITIARPDVSLDAFLVVDTP